MPLQVPPDRLALRLSQCLLWVYSGHHALKAARRAAIWRCSAPLARDLWSERGELQAADRRHGLQIPWIMPLMACPRAAKRTRVERRLRMPPLGGSLIYRTAALKRQTPRTSTIDWRKTTNFDGSRNLLIASDHSRFPWAHLSRGSCRALQIKLWITPASEGSLNQVASRSLRHRNVCPVACPASV